MNQPSPLPPYIRSATTTDASGLLALRLALDRETNFMLLEADERSLSVGLQQQRLQALLDSPNSLVLVAECGHRIVGFLQGRGGEYRRQRLTVDIVIGVLQECAGQGLGRSLFGHLEAWARDSGIHRLELTVMAHNTRAIRLYETVGFLVEGCKKDSLLVNGTFVDEIVMGKILS